MKYKPEKIRILRLAVCFLLMCLQAATTSAETETPPSIVLKKTPVNESSYVNFPSNLHWESLSSDKAIYETPYKISLFNPENGEDKKRLWSQTKSIFGYGFVVMGGSGSHA